MGRDYFQTYSGVINVVLLVSVTDAVTSIGVALMVIAILGFTITLVFSLLHFFYVTDTVRWQWSLMEMIYSQIWMILYLILSGFAFSVGLAPYIAAGIFGLMAVIAYIINSLYVYATQVVDETASVYKDENYGSDKLESVQLQRLIRGIDPVYKRNQGNEKAYERAKNGTFIYRLKTCPKAEHNSSFIVKDRANSGEMAGNYFKTHAGMINITLLVLNLICFICIVTGASTGAGIAFMVAAILGICITGLFTFVHYFNISKELPLPWLYMEMVYALLWTVYYLVTSAFVLNIGGSSYIAAGIFGILTVVVYIAKGCHVSSEREVSEPRAIEVRS